MICAKLGEVKLTKPNYELADILGCTNADVDITVKAGLTSDLCCILTALADVYDIETALNMWTKAAEIIVEERS